MQCRRQPFRERKRDMNGRSLRATADFHPTAQAFHASGHGRDPNTEAQAITQFLTRFYFNPLSIIAHQHVNASRDETHADPHVRRTSMAMHVAQAFLRNSEDGVLVTVVANQHTGYGLNKCINSAVDDYLVDLTVPKAGLVCK